MRYLIYVKLKFCFNLRDVKGKGILSHYRTGQALRDLRGWGSQNF